MSSSSTSQADPVRAVAQPRKRLAIALVCGAVLLLLGLFVMVGGQESEQRGSPARHSSSAAAIEKSFSASSTPSSPEKPSSSQARPSREAASSPRATTTPRRIEERKWYPSQLQVHASLRWIPLRIRPLYGDMSGEYHKAAVRAVLRPPAHPPLPPVLD